MEKDGEYKKLERILRRVILKPKRFKKTKEYISYLEEIAIGMSVNASFAIRSLIDNTESQKKQNKKWNNLEKALDHIISDAGYLFKMHPILLEEIRRIKGELSKFRTKKLKPIHEKLYPLIDFQSNERKIKGLGENYSEVIENIGIENKLSKQEREKLYISYMKYKNRKIKNLPAK